MHKEFRDRAPAQGSRRRIEDLEAESCLAGGRPKKAQHSFVHSPHFQAAQKSPNVLIIKIEWTGTVVYAAVFPFLSRASIRRIA